MSDDAVDGVVASRRRSHGRGAARSFTVAHGEALLRLRERPDAGPWDWTLVLVRALLALTDGVDVRATTTTTDAAHVLAIECAFEPELLDGLELGLIYDAALEPDPGAGDGRLRHRQQRFRRLLARACNEALATRPRRLELATSLGTRSFVRREGAGDPFVERLGAERSRAGLLTVRIELERTVSRWFDGLRFGGRGLFAAALELWRERVPGLVVDGEVVRLRVPPGEGALLLGTHARVLPASAEQRRRLIRDGVVTCSLEAPLREAGLPLEAIDGAIECAALQLTVYESGIVRDDAFALLVAWLHDALAHAGEQGLRSASWAQQQDAIVTADGAAVSPATLHAEPGEGRELTYVFRHEALALPLSVRARVLALWPSQLELLAREQPGLTLVPARAVVQGLEGDRLDLTALAEGSLPPLTLPTATWQRERGESLAIVVEAYVHRHAVASQSDALVVVHARVVLRERGEGDTPPGVTLTIRPTLSAGTASLASQPEAMRALVRAVWQDVAGLHDRLLEHVLGSSLDPTLRERVPLLARAVEGLDARGLELHYVATEGLTRLQWRAHPLTALVVAHERGGQPRTLGDALARARDVGGLVLGEPARRWYALEQADGLHDTWIATPLGQTLLPRVLGRAALWQMPCVPEGFAHVAPAMQQRRTLLDRDEVARLLGRGGADEHARASLLAHLLVATITAADPMGLATVPLLPVFDPRAVVPARLLSLAAVRADGRSFAIVPPGTASRDLVGPVIELPPGLASLLHECHHWPLQPQPDGSRVDAAPPREGAQGASANARAEPVLRHPIADKLAVGALALIDEGRSGVALWARGLHVGDLELPAPFAALGGRLWLSDAGVRAGRPAIEKLVTAQARALFVAARRQAGLAPPGSPRRRALERFIAHCEAVAAAADGDGVGARRAAARSRTRVLSPEAATAARLPPLRRLWLPALVRHALSRPGGFERAWLSWKLVKVARPDAVAWDLEVGGRHAWIKRAVDDDAGPADVHLAALAVVAEALAQGHAEPLAVTAALLRILATAHVSARV
ncbi:MAG: hypothetical protein IPK74_31365 [Deltaproteobacteria bacterium]|nr:hypothetical protein [Deltaproteobacteria bacterium]